MKNAVVRNAVVADAERILEIYSYYVEHTAITFEYVVPTLDEFQDRMRNTMKKYPYLVVEMNGIIQGWILSIMVGIFISKIFVPMLPYPKYRSIAYA